MTNSLTCKGTGRIVSQARQKSAIYTTEWRTWCPWCIKSAPFALAEQKSTGGGYVRRYLPHPPAQVDVSRETSEEES